MKEGPKEPGYIALLILTTIFTLCAIWTLLPVPGASKASLLGYFAHCSFTPISTVMCLLLSMITCITRAKLFVKKEAAE